MSAQEHFMGTDGFVWWYGIVEDRKDPLMLGRCRVRIFGFHTENIVDLPTSNLPWAYPTQPLTSAAMSGIGTSPTGPVEGTQVFGFFRDGQKGQEPVMLGTVGGMYDSSPNFQDGFSDQSGNYPNLDVDSHDTNRLARGIKENTVAEFKNSNRNTIKTTGSISSIGERTEQSWSEKNEYESQYPHNHVYESESGHMQEYDDTPGFERTHRSHRSGTFEEVYADGSRVQKVYGSNIKVVVEDDKVAIYGNASVTIQGNSNILVNGNANMEVDGDKTELIHGNVNRVIHGSLTERVAGEINIIADSSLTVKGNSVGIHSNGTFLARAGGNLNLDASGNIDGQATLVHFNQGRELNTLYSQPELSPSTKIESSILPVDLADYKTPAKAGIQTRPYVVLDEDTVGNVIVPRVAVSQSVEDLIDDILRREGGFIKSSIENGGCANFGVGRTALEKHRGKTLTCEDVRNMSKSEARTIYYEAYYTKGNVGLVNEEFRGVILDGNVNHGLYGNGQIVRRALNGLGADIPAKGIVDSTVADAMAKYPAADVHTAIVQERVTFYKKLAQKEKYKSSLSGWLNRMKDFGYRKV